MTFVPDPGVSANFALGGGETSGAAIEPATAPITKPPTPAPTVLRNPLRDGSLVNSSPHLSAMLSHHISNPYLLHIRLRSLETAHENSQVFCSRPSTNLATLSMQMSVHRFTASTVWNPTCGQRTVLSSLNNGLSFAGGSSSRTSSPA